MDDNLHLDTLAVRAGTLRSDFNEHSEALFLTSSFCFSSAAEAAERFKNAEEAYTYSRFTNPTVSMFQNRLAALEGGEACMATASGMAAIMSVVMSSMQQGDHLVSSKSLFGSTVGMFTQIFSKFGIETTFVDPTDLDAWKAAVRPETKMFFLETPSNPLTEIADIEAIGKIAKSVNALFVVDNCFCSPALQQPLKLGADVVMHSATKFLDGQGRVLGGALVGSKQFIMEKVFPFVRSAGPTLSAFNAWVLLKGMETLSLRVEKQSANALEIARWLESHPAVERVFYPGLESHPQYAVAKKQQKAGGAIVSFELKGATREEQRANAWRVIDSTKICSITGNLGDTRTTITHPSTTTHGRLTPEVREAAGIREGLIRLAVGLEYAADIRADLERGLDA
ncbi:MULTISPECIES: O-succinylhomoserine sulfhydrylase [unclassified Caballeronia]|uniref:O-succinylhomoserine sulfhydrylase n=1 Tax=unclassified Caballeronia TaxID=2646786 RepID=UPI002866DB04|nr:MULTISPECIES: O-succinylhomoserine sulfhydrylase [unclassified Caballeronia]MDR5754829.1 O-succinylhomoserine sulfhydrylase [Caballeronia sp. LZ024]MDR5839670.1 O-succinylhomoserine sulfhydrylase [Caballeronia sp. LZ031]